jgi:transposase-like protein
MIKYTVQNFEKEFPNDDACLEWIKNSRWPKGIFCNKCGKVTKHHRVSNRTCYECDWCGNQVYPTAGTIFHKSSTPLKLWFRAIYQMASTRGGISAKQIERETGVTYKTAWRMFHQIRKLLAEDTNPLREQVEVDETYMGGKRPGKRGRGAAGKTIVAGIAQRKGKIMAFKVPDVKANTLMLIIIGKVVQNSSVYTDELHSYNRLKSLGYDHESVSHASKVYVSGNVHTNTIDGFWSLLKRGINGTYHAISGKYLQSYVDEYVFRYNHRKDEAPMFKVFLNRISLS